MLLLMCDAQQRSPTELAENFVKYDMVSHISRYLLLASSTARTDSQEGEISTRIIECSIPILASSLSSGNAPHAAMAMLKHKFLRSVVNLLSLSPQVLDGKHQGLEYMFTMNIPLFLTHRSVVLQAIKAVKEILADREAVKTLETSILKDAWANFSQMVLERTILRA